MISNLPLQVISLYKCFEVLLRYCVTLKLLEPELELLFLYKLLCCYACNRIISESTKTILTY